MDKKFALIIDADNISAKYIKPILDELSQYGNVTYKRIYGDWTSNQNSSWKEELLKNSISPIQQFSYTYGKNATDSAMIIDAMDILYTHSVDGFCIVSSDSDFTRLAGRIRESGLTVIGMGEEKTPIPFRKACDIFTSLELLVEENKSKDTADVIQVEKHSEASVVIDKKNIEEAVIKIITENKNIDKVTGLAEIGNRLLKLYPDFDVRSYGYSLLSKFLDEFGKFRVIKQGTVMTVELMENDQMKEDVQQYITDLVKAGGDAGIDMGLLANRIYTTYTDFKVRDYGYSQFKKFINSLDRIEVRGGDKDIRAYYC